VNVALIWAQTLAGVIGADNAIPWRLPEDMAHFKATRRGLYALFYLLNGRRISFRRDVTSCLVISLNERGFGAVPDSHHVHRRWR